MFSKYKIPKFILVVILVATGAGAAVGPVLAPRLTGKLAVTATQALQIERGAVGGYGPVPGINVPVGAARSYVSLNDTHTQFTAAFDMVPTGSVLWLKLPIDNTSNNQILAKLTLDVPDGISYDIVDNPILLTTGGTTAVGRLGRNTWEVRFQPSASPSVTLYMAFAMANGTPPGFYTIHGTLEAENV